MRNNIILLLNLFIYLFANLSIAQIDEKKEILRRIQTLEKKGKKHSKFYNELFSGSNAGTGLNSHLIIWNNKLLNDTLRLESLNKAIFILKDYNPDTALYYCEQSIKLASQKGINNKLARAFNLKGTVMSVLGRIEETLEFYQKSQKLYKDINDFSGTATTNNNIGVLYSHSKQHRKSLSAYLENHKLFETLNDSILEINTLLNIHNECLALKKNDSALLFLKEAIKISKKHTENYSLSEFYIKMANFLRMKAGIMFNTLTVEKKDVHGNTIQVNYDSKTSNLKQIKSEIQIVYDSAIIYLYRAYEIDYKNGNIKGQKSFFKNYALLHLNLSYMNALDKEWIKYLNNSLIALKMIDKSLKLSKEKRLELRDPELHLTKYRLLKGLDKISFSTGRKALKQYEIFHRLIDSVKRQINSEELVRLLSEQEYNIKKKADSLKYIEQLRTQRAETRAKEEEVKAQRAETRAKEVEIKAQRAETRAKEEEIKAQRAETRAKEEEIKAQRAETRAKEEEIKAQRAETRAKEDELKAQRLEVKAQKAETKAKEEELKAKKRFELVLEIGIFIILISLYFIYRQLKRTKIQKALIEEKQIEITDSINYAKKIQDALLISTVSLKEFIPESFILFKPKDIVSGDFYWIHKNDDGTIFFTVADCTGHGVPGAFMSMIGNSLLNENIIENKIEDTGLILDNTRASIIKSLHQKDISSESRDGMDMALCKYNPKNKTVEYSGANNPLIHISGETINKIKGDSQPIGIYSGELKSFKTNKVRVKQGDMLYLFSDGFHDQFGGEKGKKYMSGKFYKFLLSISKENTEKQSKLMEEEFTRWKGSYEQIDDVCVMGVRV